MIPHHPLCGCGVWLTVDLALMRDALNPLLQFGQVVRQSLELSSHLFKRMADRDFSEIELRRMLSVASRLRPDTVLDRWIVETRHRRALWEVIVEPDAGAQLLVVITAYPIES